MQKKQRKTLTKKSQKCPFTNSAKCVSALKGPIFIRNKPNTEPMTMKFHRTNKLTYRKYANN